MGRNTPPPSAETSPASETNPLPGHGSSVRLRRCLATAARTETSTLVRFVAGGDGVVVPDVGGRLPGRGVWLSADAAALERASRKGLFARALKMPVRLPADLRGETERQLARRCLDLLSFARRSGEAVCGFERSRAWLAAGRVGVLCTASDAGTGSGSRRSDDVGAGPDAPICVDVLTADELGGVFGRLRVAHAAVQRGRLAERFAIEARRLAGFRRSGAGAVHTADDELPLVATEGR